MTLLRGKIGGFVAFLGIAALVAGGLGWVTLEALSMEAERRLAAAAHEREKLQKEQDERYAETVRQAEVDQAARMRLALLLLDNRLTPALAREDSRPYPQYLALYSPFPAVAHSGSACSPGDVYLPSPLLTADLPDWMLLHFQVDPVKGWISPQVIPAETQKMLRKQPIELALNNVDDAHRQRLDDLKRAYPTKNFIAILRDRGLIDANGQMNPFDQNQGITYNSVYPQGQTTNSSQGFNPINGQQYQGPVGRSGSNNDLTGPAKRYAENTKAMNEGMWAYLNDARNYAYAPLDHVHASRALETKLAEVVSIEKQILESTDAAKQKPLQLKLDSLKKEVEDLKKIAQQPVEVELGSMKPIWLPNHEEPRHLIVGRPVRVGEKVVYQGILLDWGQLQHVLKEAIQDVFPDAKLIPRERTDPNRLDREMYVLPVELDPGQLALPDASGPIDMPESARASWTPLRIGLALAWVAALIALLAVGLGGWTLLDLSERRIRFVSAVTHELRTPLTTLRLYLDLLTSGMVSEEKQRDEYVRTLSGEADRLHRLIGNVLDFARLEKTRPNVEKRPVPVADLLEQLRGTWNERCAAAGKELHVANAAPAEFVVNTDRNLVEQIVGNLIDNARKYSHDATDPRIWIRALVDGNRLVVEIEDRGPGVAKRERRSIFRPFRRGHDADVKAGGVGLGLALATRWASLIGAKIGVRSGEAGIGACFRLELPI
jgi:signal transduction histidine kinase